MYCYHIFGLLASAYFLPRIVAIPNIGVANHYSRSTVLAKRDGSWEPEIFGCRPDQIRELQRGMYDLKELVDHARNVLQGDWEQKNGYNHYFRDCDYGRVEAAFDAMSKLEGKKDQTRWNFVCLQDRDCSKDIRGSLAYTDYEPESVENRDSPFYAGMRNVTICPKFWTEARTKRHIPEDRSPNKDEFCGTHKSRRLKPKKVIDFETAGHTILHEITHLDNFGLAANFPIFKDESGIESHGTTDWGEVSPQFARLLRQTEAADRIPNWRNAESFAAMATELIAQKICDVDDVEE